jgi:hypothetical protein
MSEPPDVDTLARRFLQLWQEQLTLMAADPELVDGLAKLFAGLAANAGSAAILSALTAAAAGTFDGERTEPGPHGRHDRRAEPDADSAGAATAAAASRGGGVAVDQLARRLANVERRLARLEAAAGEGGREAAARPRRRRT